MERAADSRERVFHLVRNDAGELSETRETLALDELLGEGLPFAAVAKDAREQSAGADAKLRDREIRGKHAAILSPRDDLSAQSDNALLARA